jgi:hypothetical protein
VLYPPGYVPPGYVPPKNIGIFHLKSEDLEELNDKRIRDVQEIEERVQKDFTTFVVTSWIWLFSSIGSLVYSCITTEFHSITKIAVAALGSLMAVIICIRALGAQREKNLTMLNQCLTLIKVFFVILAVRVFVTLTISGGEAWQELAIAVGSMGFFGFIVYSNGEEMKELLQLRAQNLFQLNNEVMQVPNQRIQDDGLII